LPVPDAGYGDVLPELWGAPGSITQLRIADCRLNRRYLYAIEQALKAEQIAWSCTSCCKMCVFNPALDT
jgi:hypothetical protein